MLTAPMSTSTSNQEKAWHLSISERKRWREPWEARTKRERHGTHRQHDEAASDEETRERRKKHEVEEGLGNELL